MLVSLLFRVQLFSALVFMRKNCIFKLKNVFFTEHGISKLFLFEDVISPWGGEGWASLRLHVTQLFSQNCTKSVCGHEQRLEDEIIAFDVGAQSPEC